MKTLLSILGLILMVVGGAVSCSALVRYRSSAAPRRIPSWNPRHWRPVWMTRGWFTEARGFRLYVAASLAM